MRLILLLGALFVFSNQIFGQQIINGHISDGTSGIQNVNITVSNPITKSIIAFTFTNAKGDYAIKYNSEVDSLILSVRIMSYESKILTIKNQNQEINLTLEPKVTVLKEVSVARDPITKLGDTLSYNVDAFKNKNDRVLADILRKLPGIEIENSGRILYQGEAINKYYIEGLDLLGGKYNLANDNLNIEAVRSVEVLENHQPIRILDSLSVSDKAAINIRLKAKIAKTGIANLGMGYDPLLHFVNYTPMFFSRGLQAIATVQANNVGISLEKQIKSLTDSEDNSPTEWLRIQQINSPPFSENRFIDNTSKLGSINVLKQVKKELELKLNFEILKENVKQVGYTNTRFFTSRDSLISLDEQIINATESQYAKLNLSLKKNTKADYFSNVFEMKYAENQAVGNIMKSGINISQKVNIPSLTFKNHYYKFLKINKKLYALQSTIGKENSHQSLAVNPSLYVLNKTSTGASQYVQNNSWYARNAISGNFKLNEKQTLETQFGYNFSRETLNSNLFFEEATSNLPGFQNKLIWQKHIPYFKVKSQVNLKAVKLTFQLPVQYNFIKAFDRDLNKSETVNKPSFEPRIDFLYNLNNNWELRSSVYRNVRIGESTSLYFGNIMQTYRNIQKIDAPISLNTSLGSLLKLSYNNTLKDLFGYLAFNQTYATNNLQFVNKISPDGVLTKSAILNPNQSSSKFLNFRISKFFRNVKTNLSLQESLNQINSIQFVNDAGNDVKLKSATTRVDINSAFSKNLGLVYGLNWSVFRNFVAETANEQVSQISQNLKLNISLPKNVYLGIQNEYYVNQTSASKNYFLDVLLRKTITKHKIDLDATFSNIFNTVLNISYQNNSLSYVESAFALRPRQVLFRVRFSY